MNKDITIELKDVFVVETANKQPIHLEINTGAINISMKDAERIYNDLKELFDERRVR